LLCDRLGDWLGLAVPPSAWFNTELVGG